MDEPPQLSDRLGRFVVGPGLTARSLQTFIAAARFGSMSLAARHLGLSQPAVSQAVSALEGALGAQLFDRSVRPPVLTSQGAALLGPSQAVISSLERFESVLQLGNAAQLPTLRIGMVNSFAASLGPFLLAGIRSAAAELTINSGFLATRIQAVVDRDYDVVITADESPVPSAVDVLPILTEPLLIVVPANYAGDPRSLPQLSKDLELIRFGRDMYTIARLNQTLAAWGVRPTGRYHLDTHEAVLQMVANGVGWTIMPPLAVCRALDRGAALRQEPFPEQSMRRTISLVSRHADGDHLARRIHTIATTALREHFLPQLQRLMPELADQVVLHTLPDTSAPAP